MRSLSIKKKIYDNDARKVDSVTEFFLILGKIITSYLGQ